MSKEDKKSEEDKKIEILLTELSQCRDDERNDQNQILQTIAAAAAIMMIIWSITADNLSTATASVVGRNPEIGIMCLCLTSLVLCCTISYLVALGIRFSLRFHYIRSIEDELSSSMATESGSPTFIHWMSFSSPVTTRNPRHLNSKYTRIHYASYMIAIACAAGFCALIQFLQYCSMAESNSKAASIICAVSSIFAASALLMYLLATANAKAIYQYSLEASKNQWKSRTAAKKVRSGSTPENADDGSHQKGGSKISAFFYFIYPKKKDLQKVFLIVFGYTAGILLTSASPTDFIETFLERIHYLFITLIVIDFFTYQARYQWNDIRGVDEDVKCNKDDRLPVKVLEAPFAIKVSVVTLFLKIILAFVVSHIWGGDKKSTLYCGIVFVMILSVLYEFARAKECTLGVYSLVSIGYPFRFIIGLLVASPLDFKSTLSLAPAGIGLFILAYLCYGEFSVLLSWLHETYTPEGDKAENPKAHYEPLFDQIKNRIEKHPEYPVRARGQKSDPWIWFYIASIAVVSYAIFRLSPNCETALFEVLYISALLVSCFVKDKSIIAWFLISLLIVGLKTALVPISQPTFSLALFATCHQILFSTTYLFLRYSFQPNFDFVEICKKCIYALFAAFIGTDAAGYLGLKK